MRPIFIKVLSALLFILIMADLSDCGDESFESPFETEYWNLYDLTDDKTGLESIRILHKQLDDDNDGTIEPAETCVFIRDDLVRFFYNGSDNMPGALFTHLSCLSGLGLSRKVVQRLVAVLGEII